MTLRPTKTIKAPDSPNKAPEQEEPAQDQFSQRKRPVTGQFRLQVDRQMKSSYATYEEAETAGLAIKTAHPVVQVSVYDAVQGENKIIELA